jgi:hypothetical protein
MDGSVELMVTRLVRHARGDARVALIRRTSESPEERVALLIMIGLACGIPLFSRWRSDGRG